ncbi:hypothetical protein [Arthrobacter sp. ES3-54]|uniref:hypothetical protein n=1 Tax=Arthrobacter sp. ES3-54 TaxID=1502991 RepID=UPI002406D06E|nr:hypothetical protein [Arthrobacter sp. ES3-54]MDF9749050.1 hypothetical protein [Arthrobacter sp. ES3-54]
MSGATVVAGQWFQNGGIVYKTGAGVHYLPNAWLDAITPRWRRPSDTPRAVSTTWSAGRR